MFIHVVLENSISETVNNYCNSLFYWFTSRRRSSAVKTQNVTTISVHAYRCLSTKTQQLDNTLHHYIIFVVIS